MVVGVVGLHSASQVVQRLFRPVAVSERILVLARQTPQRVAGAVAHRAIGADAFGPFDVKLALLRLAPPRGGCSLSDTDM